MSNELRNAYLSSAADETVAAVAFGAIGAACSSGGEYAGGGSVVGVVNAFIPGRSGRRVGGDDELKGLLVPRRGASALLPLTDFEFMFADCLDVLVDDRGWEFLREKCFLIFPNTGIFELDELCRGIEEEASSPRSGKELGRIATDIMANNTCHEVFDAECIKLGCFEPW